MADTVTLFYEWVKPEVTASHDSWGDKLNANLDAMDAAIAATDLNLAATKAEISGADEVYVTDGEAIRTVPFAAIKTLLLDGVFEENTKTIFRQEAAPTGWTKLTDHNDAALRVVSGSVGEGGDLDFTAAFKSYQLQGAISTVTATGTIGGTALTLAQIPAHKHDRGNLAIASHSHSSGNMTVPSHSHGSGSLSAGSAGAHSHTFDFPRSSVGQVGTAGTGGNNTQGDSFQVSTNSVSHSHTLTGNTASSGSLSVSGSTGAASPAISGSTGSAGSGQAHGHAFTGTPHTHSFAGGTLDFSVAYADVIFVNKEAN